MSGHGGGFLVAVVGEAGEGGPGRHRQVNGSLEYIIIQSEKS